jgi:hypothetical protein
MGVPWGYTRVLDDDAALVHGALNGTTMGARGCPRKRAPDGATVGTAVVGASVGERVGVSVGVSVGEGVGVGAGVGVPAQTQAKRWTA